MCGPHTLHAKELTAVGQPSAVKWLTRPNNTCALCASRVLRPSSAKSPTGVCQQTTPAGLLALEGPKHERLEHCRW